MLIQTVIDHIKEYHKGVFEGKQIDEQTTRDKVLYGNPHQECTGIITTCWASVDVIREAAKRGANLIIAHEALFWNHGDHTDWLQEENNQSFLAKKKLLDEAGIVVWRDHDYIHSGIPMEDQEADQENINCYLTMEVVDFTLAEYIRDSSMLGMDKAIIGMGHFNLEEPGMEYMITYLPTAVKADIPCAYIQSGDMYDYRTR